MEKLERQLARYLFDPELSEGKMVFVSGPRQVGKTTLAKQLLGPHDAGLTYYNWDNPLTRRRYPGDPSFFLEHLGRSQHRLIVFDEIHKRRQWKNMLKGIYDSVERDIRFLVTGSARLDMLRRSGDSLVGRHVLFHLFPLSLSEVMTKPLEALWLTSDRDWSDPFKALMERLEAAAGDRNREPLMDALLRFGGFPEPFLKASYRFVRRWKDEYVTQVLADDLRDLTSIRTVDTAERIMALLPGRVGSLLSLNALAEDVDVSQPTVKNHLMQLRKLCLLFEIRPWSQRINRAVRKGAKWYFTDWIHARSEAAVFENFIAACLYRACTVWTELAHGKASLWYLRNFDGSEVDFLIALNGKPALLLEAKLHDVRPARPLRFFSQRLRAPGIQLVRTPGIFKRHDDRTLTLSADRFLSEVP
jgi:predicted AAA+ superfamily ATPase